MAEDVIRCAFTDERVEMCECGRHPRGSTKDRRLHAGRASRLITRQFGVVELDEGRWTIHRLDCHVFSEAGRGALPRFTVDVDQPFGRPGQRHLGLIPWVHVCLKCQPLSPSEVEVWRARIM